MALQIFGCEVKFILSFSEERVHVSAEGENGPPHLCSSQLRINGKQLRSLDINGPYPGPAMPILSSSTLSVRLIKTPVPVCNSSPLHRRIYPVGEQRKKKILRSSFQPRARIKNFVLLPPRLYLKGTPAFPAEGKEEGES